MTSWTARFSVDECRRLCHRWWATLTTTYSSVQNTSLRGFGLLIAYVLPGFTVLLGLATLSETLRLWLVGPESSTLAVGGVLYVTAASILVGMVLNALRWVILDMLHHATGLVRPAWNDALLTDRLSAFERLVEDHYRHYQFYGNTAIAAVFAFAAWAASDAPWPSPWPELALVALEFTLVAASRDALRRYYRRTGALLTHLQENTMTNGSHHPKPPQPKAEPKKPAANDAKKGEGKKS